MPNMIGSGAVAGVVALALMGFFPQPAAANSSIGPQQNSDNGVALGQGFSWKDKLTRDTLAPGDGWGSAGAGTTGGSAAADSRVWTVDTREELTDALARAAGEPAIIVVDGEINMHTVNGTTRTCEDYADPEWDFNAYLAAYDPVHYSGNPSGPLEAARARSQENQLSTVKVAVPSNVTLIGKPGAALIGASMMVEANNVIIRNLELREMTNCFPQRNRDGWVSEGFDYVSVVRSTNVWIDHVTIAGPYELNKGSEYIFGDRVHRVDGLLDITNASDLVTVSWSEFSGGSTSLLIGNSDQSPADEGKLRVTLHHNNFYNLAERAPRVRYGQVHAYNNLYNIPDASHYVYSWGVGRNSSLWINDNAVRAAPGVTVAQLTKAWGGTQVHIGDTLFNGRLVDAFGEYNAENVPLTGLENPAPAHVRFHHNVRAVEPLVTNFAGSI